MLIHGDDNIQFKGDNNIVGDGNTVSHNHFYNGSDGKESQKEEKVLPFTLKVYRRKTFFVDAVLYVVCFSGLIAFAKFQITLPYVIPFLILVYGFWHLLPIKFPSLLVSVYGDRVSIGDDEIFFKDIRSYSWDRDTFSYKFHNEDVMHSIQFYKYSSAEYLFYRMEQFAVFHEVRIHR